MYQLRRNLVPRKETLGTKLDRGFVLAGTLYGQWCYRARKYIQDCLQSGKVILVVVGGEWGGGGGSGVGLGFKRRGIGKKKDETMIKIYEVEARAMKHWSINPLAY